MIRGIREQLFYDVLAYKLPVSRRQLNQSLKILFRSEEYLSTIRAGAFRYNAGGIPCGVILESEEMVALARLTLIRHKRTSRG